MSFEPYTRVTYSELTIDEYEERIESTGIGFGLPLRVLEQEVESLAGVVGANFAWTRSTNWGVLVPQIRVEWKHEFEDDARQVVSRFAFEPEELESLLKPGQTDADANLLVFTDEPDRDFFNLGLGFQAVLARGVQLYLFYETIADLEDVSYNSVAFGLRFER